MRKKEKKKRPVMVLGRHQCGNGKKPSQERYFVLSIMYYVRIENCVKLWAMMMSSHQSDILNRAGRTTCSQGSMPSGGKVGCPGSPTTSPRRRRRRLGGVKSRTTPDAQPTIFSGCDAAGPNRLVQCAVQQLGKPFIRVARYTPHAFQLARCCDDAHNACFYVCQSVCATGYQTWPTFFRFTLEETSVSQMAGFNP